MKLEARPTSKAQYRRTFASGAGQPAIAHENSDHFKV